MTTVTVAASKKYDIQIGAGLLPSLGSEIANLGKVQKVCIVSETNVYPLWGDAVLNSIQTIITNVASKSTKEKVKVLVNIGKYREKREKDLQNLAQKIAGTVIKTRKEIVLEPMTAYERKIIHTKLQENDKVKTHSIGEEPYRKIVVSLK